jgi:hypothetical protein
LWPWLVVGCVAVILAVETILLGTVTSYLTNGYNHPRIDRVTFAAAFLPGAVLLDLWFVLMAWLVLVPVLTRLGASRLQVLCGTAFLASGVPILLTGMRYNVYAILGSMFSVALVSSSSTLGGVALISEALHETPDLLWMGGLFALAGVGSMLLARRLERRWPALAAVALPPLRPLSVGAVATGCVGALFLIHATGTASPLAFGFDRTFGGQVLFSLIDRATDVDLDGAGLLSRPLDPAPFDPRIHPYAVDVPGNGRDENGIGGDHPVEPEPPAAAAEPVELGRRPNVLLVYLESFRHDLLGATLNGHEITPFLNRLAREGASSAHAYVHAPWTLASRMQLFTGNMLPTLDGTTLVDDFKSRGYTVGWFSGQDDSYGNSTMLLGAGRADHFYDARQDVERRTSRSLSPISLQVSWKTLTGRTLDFLSETDPSRPIFVYLNVVDTHYPYTHAEIDPLLGSATIDRDAIRADRAREVYETYANTAANVDLAIQRVFEAFRRRTGGADLAVIVTSDHGQALYEYGTLGHGQTLDPAETQIPFIVWGLGGDWPEPIASTDLRPQLLKHLATAGSGRARFVPDPERRILQYAPALEEPRYIALRGLDGALLYDFSRDDARAVETGLGHELIWRWETLQARAVALGVREFLSARAGAETRKGG